MPGKTTTGKKLKKIIRVFAITLVLLLALTAGFNFWVQHRAKKIIEDIVAKQSNGKLKLTLKSFKYNWGKNRMDLKQAVIFNTDTTSPTGYLFETERIQIKALKIFNLLLKKELLIDSIRFTNPKLNIVKTIAPQKNQKDSSAQQNNFSIAGEIGDLSETILNVINVLRIQRFAIDKGSIQIVNTALNDKHPFYVSGIDIKVDNIIVDSTIRDKNIFKKKPEKAIVPNVIVETHNQSIYFPGNRHSLSFKNFLFNMKNQRVEFDSCTLNAQRGDSSKTAFNVFFKKLQLTNIDFDMLFSKDIIDADSVLCSQPRLLLDIDADRGSSSKNVAKSEKMDELLQQLLGDINIKYLILQNGDIAVNTHKNGKTNTFSFDKNNLEIQGLKISPDKTRPVSITNLLLTLKNYETQLADGRFYIAFDEIWFVDNHLQLKNFNFKEYKNGYQVKSMQMPVFELQGLALEPLFYDKIIDAQSAYLLNPKIFLNTTAGSSKKNNGNIFQTLAQIGDNMNMKNFRVKNGDINIALKKGNTLLLSNATLDIKPDILTASQKIRSIQNSITDLTFDKASLNGKNITVIVNNGQLTADKKGVFASGITVTGNNVNAKANGISFKNILLDDIKDNIVIDGLSWNKGNISVTRNFENSDKKKGKQTLFLLTNIHLNNTNLKYTANNINISSYLNNVVIKEINTLNKPLQLAGIHLEGNNLTFANTATQFSSSYFVFTDGQKSQLNNVNFSQIKNNDSIYVKAAAVSLTPDVYEIINNNIRLNELQVTNPIINIYISPKSDSARLALRKKLPAINIEQLLLYNPSIQLTTHNKLQQPVNITWQYPSSGVSRLLFSGFTTSDNSIGVKSFQTTLKNFNIATVNNLSVLPNAVFNVSLKNFNFNRPDTTPAAWQVIASVNTPDTLLLNTGKEKNNSIRLYQPDVRNILLNSANGFNVFSLINKSPQLLFKNISGTFINEYNTLSWYNVNGKTDNFTIDSLTLMPNLSLAEYARKTDNEKAFAKLSSGKITGYGQGFITEGKDTFMHLRQLTVDSSYLYTFKDQGNPHLAKTIKKLPVKGILDFPVKIHIDTTNIINLDIDNELIGEKTGVTSMIPVAEVKGTLYNIKNIQLRPNDSLTMDVSGKVFNNLTTHLFVKESYMDTTGGFKANIKTENYHLPHLNTILLPLIRTKIKSGQLDSLVVNANGDDNTSRGNLQLYYTNLKIRMVKKNNLEQENLWTKFVSWAANTFIIRKNNNGKPYPVYAERVKHKSPIHYLIQTILSGTKSALGLPELKSKNKTSQK